VLGFPAIYRMTLHTTSLLQIWKQKLIGRTWIQGELESQEQIVQGGFRTSGTYSPRMRSM